MGHEIDFLPVGDESSGGDAIAMRFGNLLGRRDEQVVVVIDGGYLAAGEALVEHIDTRYGTDHVDIVISTHPDQDHISGLTVVLEEMNVDLLLMHRPWMHSQAMALAKALSFDVKSIGPTLKKSLAGAVDLEDIAKRRGVPIQEPFAGLVFGQLRILGPTEAYYTSLIGEMMDADRQQTTSLTEQLANLVKKSLRAMVPETTHIETLGDDGETTPRNNSSVICELDIDSCRHLFTGDAGIPALELVADALEADGFIPGLLDLVQIPHHGSRRNVGPSILNRLLGPKGRTGMGVAYVSAPTKNPEGKHPAKKVVNAFDRRGYKVFATQGSSIWHNAGAPERWDFGPATSLPFYPTVDDDSDA